MVGRMRHPARNPVPYWPSKNPHLARWGFSFVEGELPPIRRSWEALPQTLSVYGRLSRQGLGPLLRPSRGQEHEIKVLDPPARTDALQSGERAQTPKQVLRQHVIVVF